MGCDHGVPRYGHARVYFNPRTPVGCDVSDSTAKSTANLFQSTHPSGVRLKTLILPRNADVFQSTHPSGVRRAMGVDVFDMLNISIHAPQWGATLTANMAKDLIRFQSTHPSGVRRDDVTPAGTHHRISIHAPQWGATLISAFEMTCRQISIHAPQWGATFPNHPHRQMFHVFQSTHPSGVRPSHAIMII